MLAHSVEFLPDSFAVLHADSVISAPLLNRLIQRIAGEKETGTRRPQRHSEETVEGVKHHAPSVGGEVGIVFGLSRPVVRDDDVHGHEQTVAALLRLLNRTAWGRGEGSNQYLVFIGTVRKPDRVAEVMVQPLRKVAVKKYAASNVFHVWVGCVYVFVGSVSACLFVSFRPLSY